MRVIAFKQKGQRRLGVEVEDGVIDMSVAAPDLPNDLGEILKANKLGKLQSAAKKAKKKAHVKKPAKLLPPIETPGKIICVGLNYVDHASESPYDKPDYPVLFLRVNTTLVGQNDAMIRPRASEQYDYEGEMVAVIGKKARHVPKSRALDAVAGYSVFNDGSVRDYQFKSPQWTSGKNFDASGGFGPVFVTADELPKGGRGLQLQTRLNGKVVQDANTRDLIFPVDELVAVASEVMTLEPGDIIVTGTPSGVGAFRKPPLWMKDGDVCEVEVEKIGVLRNPIKDEKAPKPRKTAAKKAAKRK
jgi:acylpyruvate hydrolase